MVISSHKIRNNMARTKAKPKKRAKLQQVSKTNADKLQAKKVPEIKMNFGRFSTDNFMPCVSNALEVLLMGDDNSVSLDESSCNASMKVFTGKEDSETNDEDSVKKIGYSETAKARTITDAANNTLASSRDISSHEGAQILLSMRKAVHSLKDLTGKREPETNDENEDSDNERATITE